MNYQETTQAQGPDGHGRVPAEQTDNAASKRLMRNLIRELFQSERSAQRHPRVEAERLGNSPPARTMQAVARHADAVLEELPARARQHDLPVSGVAVAVGSTFSILRKSAFDLFLEMQTSYRGTLLGLRHGLDVMLALREAAVGAGDLELAEWCERIALARGPLIEACTHQLAWFGQHAEQSVALVLGRSVRALLLHLLPEQRKTDKRADANGHV